MEENIKTIGNRCILNNGTSVICMSIFMHENRPYPTTKMVLYWEEGNGGQPGIAGYIPFDLVAEITDEHITDKTIYDLFRDQHLENWKEDKYYNFVNYNGIKI